MNTTHTPPRILVVEDNHDIAELMAEHLSSKGGTVKIVDDGGVAKDEINRTAYDYILLDLNLPTVSGLQLAATVKSSSVNQRTPISIVSGHVNDAALNRLQKLRIADIVDKPFDIDDLVNRVYDIIALKRRKIEKPSYDEKITNSFSNASRDIFELYGLKQAKILAPVVRDSKEPSRGAITALMGFGGNGYAGSLAFVVDQAAIEIFANHLFPGTGVELNDEAAADIAGEVCNQIIGAVKAKFLELGIHMTIGLPELIIGQQHKIIHKVKNPVLCLPVLLENQAKCYIEFVMDQRELPKEENLNKDQLVAGTALLF